MLCNILSSIGFTDLSIENFMSSCYAAKIKEYTSIQWKMQLNLIGNSIQSNNISIQMKYLYKYWTAGDQAVIK